MATVIGCAPSLNGAPNQYVDAGLGIGVRGSFTDPPIQISTHSALAWRQFLLDTFQFTLGSFTLQHCRFRIDGSTMDINIKLKFGSGSTWGGPRFEMGLPGGGFFQPVYSTSNLLIDHEVCGFWSVLDASTNMYYRGRVVMGPPPTSFPIRMRWGDDLGGTNAFVQQGTPITFDVDDEISLKIDSLEVF